MGVRELWALEGDYWREMWQVVSLEFLMSPPVFIAGCRADESSECYYCSFDRSRPEEIPSVPTEKYVLPPSSVTDAVTVGSPLAKRVFTMVVPEEGEEQEEEDQEMF